MATNPGGGGSDAYKKWLGNWSINAGAFDIALTQKVADKTINMKGWQMDQDFFEPAEVTFDSESGSIVLYGNDDEPIADNVDIGASEGACNLYYVGKFIDTDGKEYYITSGGNGPYDVATRDIAERWFSQVHRKLIPASGWRRLYLQPYGIDRCAYL